MKQIILLGLTGPFDPQLVAEIVQLIADKKLQVQHASNRYDGNLHIYTGTPDDIKAAVADCGGSCVGIQMSDIPQSLAPQAVATGDFTEVLRLLQRIDDTTSNVLLTELREFVNYEKADDAPKTRAPRAPRQKKEGAADQGGNAPLNQAGAGLNTGGENGTPGSSAPSGPPVGADGKPPEAGDVLAGGEEKAPGTEDGAQKEGSGAEEQTGAEG